MIWEPSLYPENETSIIFKILSLWLNLVSERFIDHVFCRKLVGDDVFVQIIVVGDLFFCQINFLEIFSGFENITIGQVCLHDGRQGVELSASRAPSYWRKQEIDGATGGVGVSTWVKLSIHFQTN